MSPRFVLSGEQVLAAEDALRHLATLPLRVEAAVRVAVMARAVTRTAHEIRSRRDDLVERYADRDERGQFIPATDEALRARGLVRIATHHREAFERELRDALDAQVELEVEPLRADDLRCADATPAALPPAVLLNLGPLFQT